MPPASDVSPHLRPETVRGHDGFFRVVRRLDGAWTWLDPAGNECFACAVGGFEPTEGAPELLRDCGMNVVVAAPERAPSGVACVTAVDFVGAARPIHAPGVRLPDVFDPAWPALAYRRAEEACAPWAEQREVLGWLADDALDWGAATEPGRPSLLQVCLSLEPGFAAYHAAWEFVLALHAGRLADLGKAWGLPLSHREAIRECTRNDQALASRGYLRDQARWLGEMAQRYFLSTATAIRAHAPRHLLLGARERRSGVGVEAMAPVRTAGAFPLVDVPWIPWREIGPATSGPVFAGDFTWVARDFLDSSRGAASLTSVERMLRRGRASLRRLVTHPAVVGYAWECWRDRPGERPPFAGGLVHVDGGEAREHTELVADMNRRVATLRGTASFNAS